MTVKVAVTTFDGFLFVVEAKSVKEAIAQVEAKGHAMMKFHIVKVS